MNTQQIRPHRPMDNPQETQTELEMAKRYIATLEAQNKQLLDMLVKEKELQLAPPLLLPADSKF